MKELLVCREIVIKLISETMSLLSITAILVQVCIYDVNGIQFKERQVGYECEAQPAKIPDRIMKLAIHNACATFEKKPPP